MAGEQGAGGGVESNSRQVRPNSDAESIPENEVTTRSPPKEQTEKANYEDREQRYPRRCSTPSTMTTTPHTGHTAPSSRNPPTSSASSLDTHSQSPPGPPVTKVTLSELDVSKIIHNPKLRHDINYDPDLHFRPNMDGDKGRKKQEKANLFWKTLLDQLAMFVTDREAFRMEYGGKIWCLPALLTAVKEIIQTLVPARDRVYLDEGLDVDLLMQQFDKGIADLEKLALWLSRVLKSHCAPMRDEWVDEMYSELSNGNRNNDLQELVKGMRNLLNVLEAMKLDVANHQIRCLRPALIEDTVNFEHQYQKKRLDTHKTNTANAARWYLQAFERHGGRNTSRNARHDFGETAVFFEALLQLLLPSTPEKKIPALQVFQFDEDRMYKLRADMLDAINLEICMRMYEELESRTRLPTNPFARQLQLPRNQEEGGFPSWSIELNLSSNALNYASAPGSRPSSFVFSDAGSDNSSPSPRSSIIMPTPLAFADPTDSNSKSPTLFSSLLALLQTAPPQTSRHTSRWQALAPDLALQIFRYTNASNDLLPQFEAELLSHVSNFDSYLYREAEATFHSRLQTELSRRVSEFKGLTAINLFAVATGGRIHGPGKTWDGGRDRVASDRDSIDGSSIGSRGDDSGIEDMATRIAHLGVLHWRVWSSLLYNNCIDNTEEMPDVPPV